MRTPHVWRRVARATRRVAGLPALPGGGIVLLYHRIADLACDPQCLAVSPASFADHLDIIRAHGVPMPLDELVDAARRRSLPSGAVAVTFDDGYADNFHAGAPLLARYEVPATVFVTTGAIGGAKEFWWDELERRLLQSGPLPRRLSLAIDDGTMEWELGDSACLSESDSRRYMQWTIEQIETPTPRHRAYRDLCERLRRTSDGARERTLDALAALAGVTREGRSTHRAMSGDEVKALAGSEGMRLGSHTVSHPSLASLAAEDQRREIGGARRSLETLTGMPATSFAYPFGGAADVSDDSETAARAEGMSVACTTEFDSVRAGTNPWRVPRVVVRNWSKEEFRQRWTAWTDQ